MDKLREYILNRQKAELHCHLDGSIDPEILYGYHSDTIDMDFNEFRERMLVKNSCRDLLEYFETFKFVLPLLQEREILKKSAENLIGKVALDNVVRIEIRFAPLLHTEKGLSGEDVLISVIDGMNSGIRKTGIKAGIIVCGLRERSPETTLEMMELAVKYYGRGVVGVDLAGDEINYPPELHKEGFLIAGERGVPITIHAGEVRGAANIEYSIKELGAVRIGHGINLYKDPLLEEFVKKEDIALEICPKSNLQTKSVESIETHPLKRYIENGIAVTINTDNLTASNTTLTDEIYLISKVYGLSYEMIDRIIDNAFKHSFLK